MTGAYQCWAQCARGCSGRLPLSTPFVQCPTCGGLLDIEHDVEALKARPSDAWKALLRERAADLALPHASGVWSQREWVLPHMDERRIISLGEGRTPLISQSGLSHAIGVDQLWIKQCGTSATGSFKDLGMTVLVSQVNAMRADGSPIRAMVCASTGDTSAALAAYGAAAGIPVAVLLPTGRISDAQLVQPLANGAIVLALETDFDGCMRAVERVTEDPGFYLANSKNPLRIEGQKTVAMEILQQLDWEVPDWVILPSGNLGNISALGKGFLLARALGLIGRLPRLVAAQAENADPLYRSYVSGFQTFEPVKARATAATAIQIGHPVSYERAVTVLRAFDGVVGHVSERALRAAAARADRYGFYSCPQTGVALACLETLVAEKTIRPSDRVVVISTAHGLKFTQFKTQVTSGAGPETSAEWTHRPVFASGDPDEVLRTLHRCLDGVEGSIRHR